jgi:hypothetical protein
VDVRITNAHTGHRNDGIREEDDAGCDPEHISVETDDQRFWKVGRDTEQPATPVDFRQERVRRFRMRFEHAIGVTATGEHLPLREEKDCADPLVDGRSIQHGLQLVVKQMVKPVL